MKSNTVIFIVDFEIFIGVVKSREGLTVISFEEIIFINILTCIRYFIFFIRNVDSRFNETGYLKSKLKSLTMRHRCRV